MKILLDGRLYGLENAGLGRYVMNLVEELTKLDLKNSYVILLRKNYYDKLNLPGNWQKIPVDFRHYGFKEQFFLPGIISEQKPDLVHFPHFNVPLFYKGKFIVTIHDMLMHKSKGLASTTLPAPWYFIKRLAYRLVFDRAVNKSAAVIVPSESIKDELLSKYPINRDKVHVTYEGVEKVLSDFKGENTENQYFIYAGNAYPHKNLEKLIKAICLLNKKYPRQVKLKIASSRNIFTQRLQNLIKKLNADKFVQLIGFVPDNQLFQLLNRSVAFVFPSVSEGFGLPGLEALASGTLLMASDIPVFREIYKNHASYFDPSDIHSIENAMEKTLQMSKEMRSREINQGKDFVKRYSWSKMAEETLNLYVKSCNSIRPGK